MANELDASKIDGYVQISTPAASLEAGKTDSFVMFETGSASLEVTKIDSFTMLVIPASYALSLTGIYVAHA